MRSVDGSIDMTIIRVRSSFAGRPDRELVWPPGLSAFEALRAGGQPIGSSCSGETVCGRCTVRVLQGAKSVPGPQPDERALLDARNAEADERLACRLQTDHETSVVVLTTHYW